MRHTISLQYMEPREELPRAGYEFTDADFELPEAGHVPRVGEFLTLVTEKGAKSYAVLAVNTSIVMLGAQKPSWHTYITVGPDSEVADQRLLAIRE